jgi:hypothetical protein
MIVKLARGLTPPRGVAGLRCGASGGCLGSEYHSLMNWGYDPSSSGPPLRSDKGASAASGGTRDGRAGAPGGLRSAGARAPLRSGRWRVEVDSCRVAGGDGTLAEVDVGAPRRRRPRAPAPPKSPKRCPYQRPGPGPRPPLARRAGRGGGGDRRAAGSRTGAAAGTLRRGRRALRSQAYVARP